MLGQTPLHCPGSHVAPRPDQLPCLWNNGSPGDNVISCLETALGYLSPLALAGLLWFPDKWTFSYAPYGACRILVTPNQMTTEFTPLICLSETKTNSGFLFFQDRHSFPMHTYIFFSCWDFLGEISKKRSEFSLHIVGVWKNSSCTKYKTLLHSPSHEHLLDCVEKSSPNQPTTPSPVLEPHQVLPSALERPISAGTAQTCPAIQNWHSVTVHQPEICVEVYTSQM